MATAAGVRTVTAREWNKRKLHEGWVNHQAQGSKKWKRYWMVLQKNHLLLFSSDDVSQDTMIGTLSLGPKTELREVQSSLLDPKGISLELTTVTGGGEKKVNLFKFSTPTDCDLWKAYIMGLTSGTVPESDNLLPGQLRNVMETVREIRPHPPPRPGLDEIITANGSSGSRVNQSGPYHEPRPTSPARSEAVTASQWQARPSLRNPPQGVQYNQQFNQQQQQQQQQQHLDPMTQKITQLTPGWSMRSRAQVTGLVVSPSPVISHSELSSQPAASPQQSHWLEMQQQLQRGGSTSQAAADSDDQSNHGREQQESGATSQLSAAARAWLNQGSADDSVVSAAAGREIREEEGQLLRRSKSEDVLSHGDDDESADQVIDEGEGHDAIQGHSVNVKDVEEGLTRGRGREGTVSSLRQLMRRQNDIAFKVLDNEQKPPSTLPPSRPALAPLIDRNAPASRSIKSPLSTLPENGSGSPGVAHPGQNFAPSSPPTHLPRREGWSRGSRSAAGHVTEFEGQGQRNPWVELNRKQSVSYNNNNHPFYLDPTRNSVTPPWFIDCSREKAETILSLARNDGNVLLRPSSSHAVDGKYTISLRTDIYGGSQVYHYSVMRIASGFIIDVDNPHNPMSCLGDVMQFFVSIVPNTKLLGPINLEQALSDIFISNSPVSPSYRPGVGGWAPGGSSQGAVVAPIRSQRPGENWPQPSVRANSAWAFVANHQ